MEEEIILKLKEFLSKHTSMTEEQNVVYLLVETRKLIEKNGSKGKYPILRFYCNWALHPCKSRDNQAMLEIIEKIEKSITSGPRFQKTRNFLLDDESPLKFISLEELEKEMEKFFDGKDLPKTIFQGSNWSNFRDSLIHILANQPIKNLPGKIGLICFQPSIKGAAILKVEFKDGTIYSIANYFGEDV